MTALRKYRAIFTISWQKELEYRFNFFLGRLRNITVMLLLYFVWLTLTARSGAFAGYTRTELITYVFGINVLRAVVFGTQSRQVATDINDGSFSAYLTMPVNHFLRTFSSELAQRSVYLLTSTVEVCLFALLLNVDIFVQSDAVMLTLFFTSLVLASALYFMLSYLVSLFAFWSREAMGPRFLFEWILEFASGAYFPLDILPAGFLIFLKCLPFAHIVFLPMQIYLGRLTIAGALLGIVAQMFWIGAFGLVVMFVWRTGLQKYTGEGI